MIKDMKMTATSNKFKKYIEHNKEIIISSFCSIWTHPYISTLNDNNTLTIHMAHKEITDDLFNSCLDEINSLISEVHPYQTATH
jgi:hypothetical protein